MHRLERRDGSFRSVSVNLMATRFFLITRRMWVTFTTRSAFLPKRRRWLWKSFTPEGTRRKYDQVFSNCPHPLEKYVAIVIRPVECTLSLWW